MSITTDDSSAQVDIFVTVADNGAHANNVVSSQYRAIRQPLASAVMRHDKHRD